MGTDNSDLQNWTSEQLRSEIERLRSLLSEEPKLTKIHYTPEEGGEFEIEHWAVRFIVASLAETIQERGAVNYLIATVNHPTKGPIEVTVRFQWGTKSREQCLKEENAALRLLLDQHRIDHQAIAIKP